MKTLSISVAAYNAEKYIERCLDSFIDERIIDDLEIFVVDDGGTDGTLGIAEKYEQNYPNSIRAIHKENGGHGSTINTSIELATGKYFKIVDADDWVEPEGLIKLIEALKVVSTDMVLNPYCTIVDGTNNKHLVKPFLSQSYECISKIEIDIDQIADKTNLPMHSITFKTDLLKKSDRRMTEKCFYVDSEYTSFFVKDVNKVIYLNDVVYCYRIGANEQSVSFSSMQKRRFEHMRVCLNVLRFYLKEKGKMGFANEMLIRRRVIDLINAQYKIILSLPETNKSKMELRDFFNKINNESDTFLAESFSEAKKLGYEVTKLASFLYNTEYCFFKIINCICRMKFGS